MEDFLWRKIEFVKKKKEKKRKSKRERERCRGKICPDRPLRSREG